MKTSTIAPTTTKKRPGGERGKSKDRRARKNWMLGHFGDSHQAHCIHCQSLVNYETMEVDREVIGGKYIRSNVVPSCKPCNRERSDNREWVGSNPRPRPDRPIYGAGSYVHNDPESLPTLRPLS